MQRLRFAARLAAGVRQGKPLELRPILGTPIACACRNMRRALARAIDGCGALEAILTLRARVRAPWLTVLTYHRINDDPAGQPFDDGVIDASSAELDAQVGLLRRHFNLIGLEDLLRFLAGRPLPKNPAIISFDDGYRDCFDRALPVLEKHGAKAVFFIPTSYLSERRVFWWDRIAYAIKRSRVDRLRLTYPEPIELELGDRPASVIRRLQAIVKRRYALDIQRFLEELTQAACVEWSAELERRYADDLIMTWDQVRSMRAAGMEIHSHTRTHRILQTVPASELVAELAGARADLEEQLGEPVRALSYPVGYPIAKNPVIRSAVQDAGYDLGFSNTSGLTWLSGRFDPLDIHRLAVERGMPLPYFRALVALPNFAETATCA
jgi:peptidoglycan/xylan/chitin deacetylase (PgdA/CDA1 family)